MDTIILVLHLVIVTALIFVILIQRTGQDGLSGLGGASSGGNALFSVRGKANLLTRLTSILATLFIVTSMTLAYFATHKAGGSIADKIAAQPAAIEKKLDSKDAAKPAETKPAEPQVPLAK